MTPTTLADAEHELRRALDAGDWELVPALSDTIDRLDQMTHEATLHAAALWYAAHGIHVFPLTPMSKIPFKGSGGFKDATTDPQLINRWWTGNPQANIGIATGHLIDVVDIDGHTGQVSRAHHWDQLFNTIDQDAVAKVLTPRPGGMHIYVPATGDGNSTSIVPNVDYRGRGGYVVAPPSRNEQGTYRFLGTPTFDTLTAA